MVRYIIIVLYYHRLNSMVYIYNIYDSYVIESWSYLLKPTHIYIYILCIYIYIYILLGSWSTPTVLQMRRRETNFVVSVSIAGETRVARASWQQPWQPSNVATGNTWQYPIHGDFMVIQ